MTMAEFREVIDVHLMGSVICTKAVWEIMREQRHGRVVMTTSSSGLFGNFGQTNYGAAKMALVGLMQTLALEGEKYGIKVNCLAPTAATAMTDGLLSPDAVERLSPDFVSPAPAGAGRRRCADAGDPVRRRGSFRALQHHAHEGRLCRRRRGCSRARGCELGAGSATGPARSCPTTASCRWSENWPAAGHSASDRPPAARRRRARRHSEEAAGWTKPSVRRPGGAGAASRGIAAHAPLRQPVHPAPLGGRRCIVGSPGSAACEPTHQSRSRRRVGVAP